MIFSRLLSPHYFAILLCFVIVGASSAIEAAVPRRNIALVCINLDGAPASNNAVKSIADYAKQRLRLNPDKVITIDRPTSISALQSAFGNGNVFRRVSHDDMILVYLSGATHLDDGVVLSNGLKVTYTDLFNLRETLRKGPGGGAGFFEGKFLFITQSKTPIKTRTPANVALLSVYGETDPITIGTFTDGASDAWLNAHHVISQRGMIERGAVSLIAALESIIASPGEDNRTMDLPIRYQQFKSASAQSARFSSLPQWRESDPPLLMEKIRIALFPRLLKNKATRRILGALKLELESKTPQALRPHIEIALLEKSDPTADIRCQVVANAQKAHIECVEQRAPIFSDWIATIELDDALVPVVKQVLRDYKALTQTDWSKRTRRDLRPLDIYALIDTSLSMAYHDPTALTDPILTDGPSKRETFLIRLASAVSEHAERTGRQARLTVLLFGESIVPLRMPGSNSGTVTFSKQLKAEHLNAIGAAFRMLAKPQRYTGIETALTETALRMAEVNEAVTRHVVLLTDGKESMNRADPRGSVRRAARAVRSMGATLDVIGLSENDGRLTSYLSRMRAGKPVLNRYVQLLDMTFAPQPCRRPDAWSRDMARKCGGYFAQLIGDGQHYDAALLDEVRRSREQGVPTGMFMQPSSISNFQDQLQVLISSIVGKGIYASKSAKRVSGKDGRVNDEWNFNLSVGGRARVVLYNQDRLYDLRFTVLRNGQKVSDDGALLISKESDSTTVVTLPAPATGTFKIIRSGARQK
jgi:hypothetical protein